MAIIPLLQLSPYDAIDRDVTLYQDLVRIFRKGHKLAVHTLLLDHGHVLWGLREVHLRVKWFLALRKLEIP